MELANEDNIFLHTLIAQSKIEPEAVSDALTISDGHITEIRLSTSFHKLKSLPSVAALTRLSVLSVSEDTAAKRKRWLMKELVIESATITSLKIEIGGLTNLRLDTPKLTSLRAGTGRLDTLAVAAMPHLTSLRIYSWGQPFTWLHNPETLLHFEFTASATRDGSAFDEAELPVLRAYTGLKYLLVDARGVRADISVKLSDHPSLEVLHAYSGGQVSVDGNFSALVRYTVSERTATSETLHAIADTYNWDLGTLVLTRIVCSSQCSLDTALMIYWLGRPTWYLQYASDDDVPEHEQETLALLRLIEQRVEAEALRTDVSFAWERASDPHLDDPKLRKVPAIMLKRSPAPTN